MFSALKNKLLSPCLIVKTTYIRWKSEGALPAMERKPVIQENYGPFVEDDRSWDVVFWQRQGHNAIFEMSNPSGNPEKADAGLSCFQQ